MFECVLGLRLRPRMQHDTVSIRRSVAQFPLQSAGEPKREAATRDQSQNRCCHRDQAFLEWTDQLRVRTAIHNAPSHAAPTSSRRAS